MNTGTEVPSVVLPCDPDDFRSFISSLLGKPQTITRIIRGPFEVRKRDIENLYHLVDQRVTSQNRASLVQFLIRIVYTDGSSVQLNSIQAFCSYNEVKPLSTAAVHISWTFLIQFNTKSIPEKQQVDVSILSRGVSNTFIDDDIFPIQRTRAYTDCQLRISHTDRSWGADIDGLLTGSMKSLQHPITGIRGFISRQSGKIGITVAFIIFAISTFGLYYSSSTVAAEFLKASSKYTVPPPSFQSLSKQVELLTTWTANSIASTYTSIQIIFMFISIIGAIAAGVGAEHFASQKRPNYIIFTQKDEEEESDRSEEMNKGFIKFFLTAPGAILMGITANYFFYLLSRYFALQ